MQYHFLSNLPPACPLQMLESIVLGKPSPYTPACLRSACSLVVLTSPDVRMPYFHGQSPVQLQYTSCLPGLISFPAQVPFGMKLGSTVTVGRYIGRSMVPDWIGNTLSACFFLAGSYAFCYGTLPMRIERVWLKLRGKSVPQDAEILESNNGVVHELPNHTEFHDNKHPVHGVGAL